MNALGLIDLDTDSSSVGYASMIQTCARYLLEQMTVESTLRDFPKRIVRGIDDERAPLSQLVRIDAQLVSTCSNCSATTTRETSTNVVDLLYPRTAMSNEARPSADFASTLKASMVRETTARMQCAECKQNSHMRMRRRLSEKTSLPPVMIINAGVRTSNELEYWLNNQNGGTFLSPSFSLSADGNVSERTEDQSGVQYHLKVYCVSFLL